jgi:hypothetical protein
MGDKFVKNKIKMKKPSNFQCNTSFTFFLDNLSPLLFINYLFNSTITGVRHVLRTDNYLGLSFMIGRKIDIFAYVKDKIWKRNNS